MSPFTKLIISIVIAIIVSTLTSVLLSGELIDWRLFVAFVIATVSTALIAGTQGDSPAANVATATSRPSSSSSSSNTKRDQGSVKWFNASKGFGFIVKDDGEELFVHFRSIRGEGRRGLRDGQRVSFIVAQSDKGPQAEDVAPAD